MLDEESSYSIILQNIEFFSAKITEQCANLTMAFRTNYHAYVGFIYFKKEDNIVFLGSS